MAWSSQKPLCLPLECWRIRHVPLGLLEYPNLALSSQMLKVQASVTMPSFAVFFFFLRQSYCVEQAVDRRLIAVCL